MSAALIATFNMSTAAKKDGKLAGDQTSNYLYYKLFIVEEFKTWLQL